jgi:hypothetical protein
MANSDCGAKPKLISIGISPLGIISIGIVPMGVVSIGVVPMGVISIGAVAMGVINASVVGMGVLIAGVNVMGVWWVGLEGMGPYRLGDQPGGCIITTTTKGAGRISMPIPASRWPSRRPGNWAARASMPWGRCGLPCREHPQP